MKQADIDRQLVKAKRMYVKFYKAYSKNNNLTMGNARSSVLYILEELLPCTARLSGAKLLEIRNMCQIIQSTYKVDCAGLRRCNTLVLNFSLVYARKPKKGRPVGHKLSDESKAKISATKTGQTHSDETKRKIAASVKNHYKNNPEASEHLRAWWAKNPGFKLAFSDFMKAYWEERRALAAAK